MMTPTSTPSCGSARDRMDDTIAGMGDIELNRAVRMLEKRFTVAVLLEPDKSRIRTCIARQQAAKRTRTDNESERSRSK